MSLTYSEPKGGSNCDLTALVANAIETGQSLAKPVGTETVHYALVPANSKLQSLEPFQWPDGRPKERIESVVRLYDADSFVKYVQAYADERTRVFSDPRQMSFTGVLDYHVAGDRKPEFLKHHAVLGLELDERWKIWSTKDGAWFSQTDFAEFLEDNYRDIDTPPAARMLEVARDLHAKNDVSFDSKVNLSNGEVQMTYSETIKGSVTTGGLDVPETFTIRLPVFFGEQAVVVDMRLRYRITNQKLVFCYRMYRRNEILQQAFRTAAATVAAGLKTEVLMGTIVS